MPSNITVDGCDYTIRTADAEDGWDVRNVYGDIVADFSISDVCEGGSMPTISLTATSWTE